MVSGERDMGFSPSDQTPSGVVRTMLRYEEAMDLLLDEKPILMCGMSFVGREGFITRVVSIVQATMKPESLKGWSYRHRISPSKEADSLEGFHRIHGPEDAAKAQFPGTMFAVIAEVDPTLIDERSEQIVKEVINWAISMDHPINEEPPFKDIT